MHNLDNLNSWQFYLENGKRFYCSILNVTSWISKQNGDFIWNLLQWKLKCLKDGYSLLHCLWWTRSLFKPYRVVHFHYNIIFLSFVVPMQVWPTIREKTMFMPTRSFLSWPWPYPVIAGIVPAFLFTQKKWFKKHVNINKLKKKLLKNSVFAVLSINTLFCFYHQNILKGYCCFGFCYNTHTVYRLNRNTFTNEFAHSAHSFITIHKFSYTCVQNTYTFYTSLDTFQETPCKIHQKQSVFYIFSDFHIRYVTVGKKKVRVFMNSHHFYRWLIARVKISRFRWL